MKAKRPLGDLLSLCLDVVDIVPTDHYRIAGVYSFGRGLFERGPISGAETSYRTLHRLHAGQLVVSRLKAFEGALAVVPAAMEGWFLSPEFPTFECIEGALEPGFLTHFCRWPEFWSMLAATSKGIGARRERVHAADLLQISIRIPGPDKQRSVAERLDRITESTERLVLLDDLSDKLSKALAVSVAARPDLDVAARIRKGWRRVALGEVMTPADDVVSVESDKSYPNAGIYSYGRGLFPKPNIEGARTSAKTLNRIHAGQFIYSRLFAFEGAYAFVDSTFDGAFVSNEFPSLDPDRDQLDARWLATYLRSPERWAELSGFSKGLGVRRQRIPVEALLAYEVWLPPVDQQAEIALRLDQLVEVQQSRTYASTRIRSLVPAALNQAFAGLG